MENDGERDEGTAPKSRIYIGGLGKNVTENEIRKTFSGLGNVEAVEILRTKGRSLAYIDFVPSDSKSLPKLFSTYNGCLWKGGRLKLEKAKEHYLLRLKREWAADAQLAKDFQLAKAAQLAKSAPNDSIDASKSKPSLEKPKKLLTAEKPQLRIFFPKLNKMKCLPFSGSGKHKYSFQHVTAPSLPIHFCDCEEHYDSSHVEKGRPFDLETAANEGIKEEELNIMESVMNKLFTREKQSKAVSSEAKLVEDSTDPVDLPVQENVSDPPSDEDNLIINMVGGDERKPISGSRPQKVNRANQEPTTYGGSKTSKRWPFNEMHETQRNKNEPYNRKRKSPQTEACDDKQLGSFNTERKSLVIPSKEQEDKTTEPESRIQLTDKFSWSQKSAWRDLVGKRGDTSFQISHVMPSASSAMEEKPQISHVPSSKEKRSKISHIDALSISLAEDPPESSTPPKEKQSKSDDLNLPFITDIEDQNLLNEKAESERAQSALQVAEAPFASVADVSIKSARGASWLQKSSWIQLVSDTNKSSFSISQILPGLSFEKQELQQPSGSHAATSSDLAERNLFKPDEVAHTGHSPKDSTQTNEYLDTTPRSDAIALDKSPALLESERTMTEEKQPSVGENNQVAAPTLGLKQPPKRQQIVIGETCSFMRNADSVKEWAKAKAALSSSLKKKGDGK